MLGRIIMLTHDQQIDRRILAQANTLSQSGWDVKIIAMASEEVFETDKHYDILRLNPTDFSGKTSLLFRCYRKLKNQLGINSRLYQLLKKIAIQTIAKPEQTFLKLYMPTAKNIVGDIYLAHDLPMLPIAANLAKLHNKKLVYDCHEFYPFQDFSHKESKIWQQLEKKHIHDCDAVITVNPSLAKKIKDYHNLKKIHVIENSLNSAGNISHQENIFHRKFKLQTQDLVVLFQGNLAKNKHLETLIKAIPLLQNKNIHLIIMGNGPLKCELQRISSPSQIHFHSAVSQDKLLQYTASANAGIIPYQATCLNNQFCTPNKLYEFIAAGIPIIATDLPELRRIITENYIGLVGNNETPKKMAALIDDFFQDPEKIKQQRKRLKNIQKKFSWASQEKKLETIFSQLIKLCP